MPAIPADTVPLPPSHLRWALPLVVDLDALCGLRPAGSAPPPQVLADPCDLHVPQAGLDLLRLQRRFRARVLMLSGLEPQDSAWLAQVLGFDGAVWTLSPRESVQAAVLHHFELRQFDLLGTGSLAAAAGPYAQRVWLLGRDIDLQRRLVTQGVRLLHLAPSARVRVSDLIPLQGQSWSVRGSRVATRPHRVRSAASGRRHWGIDLPE